MCLDDAGGDGQAQAGAAFFGGKKRIEKPLFNLRSHPLPRVGDLKDRHRRVPVSEETVVAPRPQGNKAILADAVRGVLDKVNNDLLDLLWVSFNLQGRRILQLNRDVGPLQLG